MSTGTTMTTAALFPALTHTQAAPLLASCSYPWQALPFLHAFIATLGPSLGPEYTEIAPGVWAAHSADIAASAAIDGPCVIGPGAQLRHCAFIRGSALIGAGAVVGNSTEIKNAVLFDGVQVPHYNYVGDSILGYKAHLGAGAVLSNLRLDGGPVTARCGSVRMATGLRKLGGILGDGVQVGCNVVINPGKVVPAGTFVL